MDSKGSERMFFSLPNFCKGSPLPVSFSSALAETPLGNILILAPLGIRNLVEILSSKLISPVVPHSLHLSFEIRPFFAKLILKGNVVEICASRFLGKPTAGRRLFVGGTCPTVKLYVCQGLRPDY